jgi:hypothetical protein
MEMPDRMENEETKTRFPFVSHRPWKSLRDSHIPTARLLLLPFPLKTKTKTKGGLAAELHSSFRLIVGLENAALEAPRVPGQGLRKTHIDRQCCKSWAG